MSPPNPPTPNKSVDDAECWSRTLTNTDHVTKNGTLHLAALTGRNAFSPTKFIGFTHELSGRLVSLVAGGHKGIEAEALERLDRVRQNYSKQGKPVPSKFQFAGVSCATAIELRKPPIAGFASEVIFTPNQDPAYPDPAHTDFLTSAPTDDALDDVRKGLLTRLMVIRPAELAQRLSICGKPPPIPATTS
jgi:hypothetical protein